MKIILTTSFEVRTRWFQLLCRHRRYATPFYLPRPRNERTPHYRYAIRIYWYVHPSPASYTTYRDRTRFFYCTRSRVGHGVRKKELSAGLQFIETRIRHGHGAITVTNTIDSRAYLTTACCQEKWSGKYLTYRTGGYGPESTSLTEYYYYANIYGQYGHHLK